MLSISRDLQQPKQRSGRITDHLSRHFVKKEKQLLRHHESIYSISSIITGLVMHHGRSRWRDQTLVKCWREHVRATAPGQSREVL